MLANSEVLMSVVHEAQVRQATAHSEHLLEARLAARERNLDEGRREGGWRVWLRLGASRRARLAA